MKYQDLKIRDAGRLALIGFGLGAIAALAIRARSTIEPFLRRRYWPTVWALEFVCPFVLAMAVWYLVSSPAQDAKFLKWAARTFRWKPGPKFDPALLDETDPSYNASTFRYWMVKRRRRLP